MRRLVGGGAANCNALAWGAPWRWTEARVVALLVVVGVVGEGASGRSWEGLRLVAWYLVAHGACNAWAVLGASSVAALGGLHGEELARVALLSVGALDARAAAGGRAPVVARRDVLVAAARALRAAGCRREVIAAELVALVAIWSRETAEVDVWRAMRAAGMVRS